MPSSRGDHCHYRKRLVHLEQIDITNQPARLRTLSTAGTGAVVNSPGSCAYATSRATTGRPSFSATLSRGRSLSCAKTRTAFQDGGPRLGKNHKTH
jgi:hypothetical protein